MENQSQELEFVGILEGHGGWVTSITTPQDVSSDIVVSGSRDKQLFVWSLNRSKGDGESVGFPRKSLQGHSHFVSDVVISNDGCYAISGSWDHTLRLWDLQCGKSLRSFIGHKSDIHSVSFSAENRQIVAGGRDRTIKLWNTLAQCKYTFEEDCHNDWVSCVKFSPLDKVVVSSGWDRVVKVWDLKMCKLKYNFVKHDAVVNCVTVSPDGSLCASGGKDGVAMLWDVKEGKHLYSLDAHHGINSLCFSPCMYWLCAATDKNIIIWDLENKVSLVELEPPKSHRSVHPWCISLAWTADGKTLLAGCTDNNIYVYEVTRQF